MKKDNKLIVAHHHKRHHYQIQFDECPQTFYATKERWTVKETHTD